MIRRPLWAAVAIVVALAAAGFAARLAHIGQWPSGFRNTLEFDSANAARTIYLRLTETTEAWQEPWLAAGLGRFLEPPLLQALTAFTYLPDGVERPWTSVLFTAVFWVVGSVFVFLTVRARAVFWGGLLALAFALFWPFALAVSVSFQPEAVLFMALAIVVWYAATRDVIDGRRLLVAAAIGGLAGLSKPGVLLPFIAAMFALSAVEHGDWRDRRRLARLAVLVIVSTLPALAYAAVWLPGQTGAKLLPSLLLSPDFYFGWWQMVSRVVGVVPLVAAIAGFVLAPRLRLLGLTLALAYGAYSAAFTWHTMTHDYYQVPLLFIVALGLGGLEGAVVEWAGVRRLRAAGAFVVLVVVTVFALRQTPRELLGPTPWTYPEATQMAAIGEAVGPGTRVIAFTSHYGFPLMYHGRLLVASWPTADDVEFDTQRGVAIAAADERLRGMITTTGAQHFVTTQPERADPALYALLECGYELATLGPDWRVYDLSRPREQCPPA